MASPRLRRFSVLTALLLVGEIAQGGRAARASQVEVNLEMGALIPRGLPETGLRPTLGMDRTRWWTPAPPLELGLQMGLGITELPYGNSDGEPVIGMRSKDLPNHFDDGLTLLPRLMFCVRTSLWSGAGLGAFIGPTFLVSGHLAEYSILPYPTAGVALDIRFGAEGRFGARAAFSYVRFPFHGERAFLAPTLAINWR